MKILVTGAAGQLGRDITKLLDERGIDYRGVDIADCDITDAWDVMRMMEGVRPTHVMHCAAYTAVDRAESEQELCLKVNAFGTANIARACADMGAEILYFSTDYVFDGMSKDTPWEASDDKEPINTYGKTKLLGERSIEAETDKFYTMRISWVYGAGGANFVKTMLRLAGERDEVSVVNDQVGAPTYTVDAAERALDIISSGAYGVYHAPNDGYVSWYGFAKEIFELCGKEMRVNPIPSSEYKAAAPRPKNSRLSKRSLDEAGFSRLPYYGDALKRYLKETGFL